jgi:hypothetical protein
MQAGLTGDGRTERQRSPNLLRRHDHGHQRALNARGTLQILEYDEKHHFNEFRATGARGRASQRERPDTPGPSRGEI